MTFSSNGKNYSVTGHDIFYDNGIKIVYIRGGKTANQTAPRIEVGKKEWERIKPRLDKIDYEKYYGRKPALSGVSISIYKIKEL